MQLYHWSLPFVVIIRGTNKVSCHYTTTDLTLAVPSIFSSLFLSSSSSLANSSSIGTASVMPEWSISWNVFDAPAAGKTWLRDQ